jgi:hypothetical protein
MMLEDIRLATLVAADKAAVAEASGDLFSNPRFEQAYGLLEDAYKKLVEYTKEMDAYR